MNRVYRVYFFMLLVFVIAFKAEALDYPHNSENNYSCENCHYVYGSEPTLLPEWTLHIPEDIDDTQYNTLCWSCHDNLTAPYMKTHSSLVLDNGYGDWAVECRVCHNPHKQQFRSTNHGGQAYVIQGTVAAVDASTLTASGASWATDEYAGYVLVPNIAKNDYNYKILSNTGNVLTIDDRGNGVTIDTAKVSPTDTFGISYGKLVYDIIYLDKINDETPVPPVTRTGTRTVKFFNNEGTNSFADGDGVWDGICEACHQQTDHFQYDGDAGDQLHSNMGYPAGTNCTNCHKHENGFIGMGDGAHITHVIADNGPKLACADCHGTNIPPVLKDGLDLANTAVCDNCHSADGIATAKSNQHEDPGTWAANEGEESFCGSCHDLTPGNDKQDGTGDDAPDVAGNKLNFGFFVTGHGRPTESGLFTNLSWQEAGLLLTRDFGIFDTNDDNPAGASGDKSVSAIQHTAGSSIVTMTINATLIAFKDGS